jgi:hypothetical protein
MHTIRIIGKTLEIGRPKPRSKPEDTEKSVRAYDLTKGVGGPATTLTKIGSLPSTDDTLSKKLKELVLTNASLKKRKTINFYLGK